MIATPAAIMYQRWTTCHHCGLPYAVRHHDPPSGHACSVVSGCFVIQPFRRCPTCDATVHERCPVDVACPGK